MGEEIVQCPICERFSAAKLCSYCLGDKSLVEIENRERDLRLDKQRFFHQKNACTDLEAEEKRMRKPSRKILKWLKEESFNLDMNQEILDKEIDSIKRERRIEIEHILGERRTK